MSAVIISKWIRHNRGQRTKIPKCVQGAHRRTVYIVIHREISGALTISVNHKGNSNCNFVHYLIHILSHVDFLEIEFLSREKTRLQGSWGFLLSIFCFGQEISFSEQFIVSRENSSIFYLSDPGKNIFPLPPTVMDTTNKCAQISMLCIFSDIFDSLNKSNYNSS